MRFRAYFVSISLLLSLAASGSAGEVAGVYAPPSVKQPSSPTGRTGGNMIYYLFLPSTKASLGTARLKKIVDAGNVMLISLGVKTRMAGLMMGDEFDPALLDAHDKLCILGDKPEVLKMLLRVDPQSGYVDHDWAPENNNPEISDQDPGGKGKWTVVDVGAVKRFAASMGGKAGPEMIAALFAIHGVGHQCGIGHPEKGNFMDDGSRLSSHISGKGGYVDEQGYMTQGGEPKPVSVLFSAENFATMTTRSPQFQSKDKTTQRAKWLRAFGDDEPLLGYSYKASRPASAK